MTMSRHARTATATTFFLTRRDEWSWRGNNVFLNCSTERSWRNNSSAHEQTDMKRFLVTLLIMPGLSAASFAAEIKILSAGAVETGLQAFAPLVKRETGHDLKTQFNTTPQIAQRIAAGEAFDIVIAPPDTIARAAKDGKVVAETQVPVGRVGGGIVVRSGASAPDIATVDALKRALLAADSVGYNTASSGIYLD